ncbi:MAG TPA: SDR family oxidoreductase, partial [Terriglobia bacterium]|nr:SDR family oxidoreductase [Terriglobia bacterium]
MKYHTPWRWNPIRGEYDASAPAALQGTGEISAIDAFSNRTMLLLGGTGFVGKVLLAMVLDRFPELKHLVVQVRRKKNVAGEQRFYSEVLQSPPLRPIVERLGGEKVIHQKVSIVEGDLDEPLCGVTADQVAALKGTVDIVVNLAGLVDFDPPINESIEPNVYGTQHVIDLVQALDAKLVHISTCYVAGKKDGHISEDTPIDGYFPRRGENANEHFSVP